MEHKKHKQELERLAIVRAKKAEKIAAAAKRKRIEQRWDTFWLALFMTVVGALIVLTSPGCKTIKRNKEVTNTTVSNTSDSLINKTKEVTAITEKTETKPASRQEITAQIEQGADGKIKSINIQTNSGADSLKLEVKDGKIKTSSNCAAQVNYWRSEVTKRDSLLAHKKAKAQVFIQKVVETQIKEVVPRWVYWAGVIEIGLLICFLYIKLRKYIPL